MGGARYWVLMVDQYSKFKISGFLKKKSDMGNFICRKVSELKNKKIGIRFIICDNASENKIIESKMIEQGIDNITFEYTAPSTPQ